MDDLEIMELIAQGDERGMPELQKRYGALVRYVAAPILGSGAAVSDCVSEVYLRVLEKFSQFDPERQSRRVAHGHRAKHGSEHGTPRQKRGLARDA